MENKQYHANLERTTVRQKIKLQDRELKKYPLPVAKKPGRNKQ